MQRPFAPKSIATQLVKSKDTKEIKISDERQEIYLKVLRKNVGGKCGKKAHQGDLKRPKPRKEAKEDKENNRSRREAENMVKEKTP